MSLLQMSFSGAILILVVLVVRAVAINRLPKKTFLFLWGIVFLKLLIPFSIPSAFSIYSLVEQRVTTVLTGFTVEKVIQVVPQGQIDTVQGAESLYIGFSTSNWFIIWCIGMILLGTFFIMSYLRCQFEFQTSLPINNDFVEHWLCEHQLKRPISIRQSDRISSPLTYGFFRPIILMPKKIDWDNTMQLQYILLHEYLHICHYDIVIKLISVIALCIHWFNPMVWVMYVLLNRDIELVCDEHVVKLCGINTKSSYALILISMEEQKSGLAPLCNNFNKNAIEERIIAIMKTKKTTGITIILAGLIILGIASTFATSAYASQSQQTEPVEQNDEIEYKPTFIPPITDDSGVFFKDNNKQADSGMNDIQTASQLQASDIYGEPVEKAGVPTSDLTSGNIIYFNTEAERDEHFRALEANTAKGLNRYAGFEDMYADIDTSAPITYIVK